ncbi:PH domain-containing protein [Candidatus Woesearchaeota archaeon]|nr:PH domain-containing protein [Candidatus Woesearchaeota archaeon]
MKKENEKETISKTVSLKLMKTRKAFIPEYLAGLFLIVLLLIFQYKEIALSVNVKYFVGGLALFSLVSPEITRWMHRYHITDSKLIIISGLIKQHKKHVYFYPLSFVPDLNVRQSRLQRIMNYGTVSIRMSVAEWAEVKDVNSPHKIMKILEDRVEYNKRHR